MSAGSLGSTIEGIFLGKGYNRRLSSPDNRLIVMVKGEEVLSIGYSDIESPSTQGELEMFISISESEGATDQLFISPARIQRDLLGLLRGKGIQVWDRTALVLAIGENELRKAVLDSVEEWDAESESDKVLPLHPFVPTDDIDPVAELRKFEKELSAQERSSPLIRTPPQEDPAPKSIPRTNVRYRSFPGSEPATAQVDPPKVEMPAPKSEAPVSRTEPVLAPVIELPAPPQQEVRMIAPLRVGKEEASSLAPGSVKELQLVYRPYLLLEMSYDIRSKDGSAQAERKGSFMVDLIDRVVTDMPASALSGISAGASMEVGSQLEEMGAIGPEEARRAVAESIRVRDHVIERKIHDGMMSTIFRETESTVVDGSIRTESELEIRMPVWKGRLSFGGMTWMMDGFAGTQRRAR